jgi:hypothetical protein
MSSQRESLDDVSNAAPWQAVLGPGVGAPRPPPSCPPPPAAVARDGGGPEAPAPAQPAPAPAQPAPPPAPAPAAGIKRRRDDDDVLGARKCIAKLADTTRAQRKQLLEDVQRIINKRRKEAGVDRCAQIVITDDVAEMIEERTGVDGSAADKLAASLFPCFYA